MSTVDLPGIGPVDRKWLYIGGGVVALVVGLAYVRSRAGGAGSGEVEYDPATGSPGGGGGYVNPAPSGGGGDGGDFDPPDEVPPMPGEYVNRQAWVDDVVTRLSMTWETSFVLSAIGRWFDGQILTAEEADLIRSALALGGPPPGGAPPIKVDSGRRVPEPPKTPPRQDPAPPKAPPSNDRPRVHVVKSGDTLSRIAALHGVSVSALYERNKSVIESAAKSRGLPNSRGPGKTGTGTAGWWIFPSTTLEIP